MVSKDDVARLAQLARLEVAEEHTESLADEMSGIVDFVSQVQEISGDAEKDISHKNILREDANAHDGALFTEDLLANAPSRKGQHISVPKIISND